MTQNDCCASTTKWMSALRVCCYISSGVINLACLIWNRQNPWKYFKIPCKRLVNDEKMSLGLQTSRTTSTAFTCSRLWDAYDCIQIDLFRKIIPDPWLCGALLDILTGMRHKIILVSSMKGRFCRFRQRNQPCTTLRYESETIQIQEPFTIPYYLQRTPALNWDKLRHATKCGGCG